MKKLYILLIFFAFAQYLNSQENDGYQTIFGGGMKRISAFGGPFYNFSVINNEFILSSGGGGALLINDFFIGGFGIQSKNPIPCSKVQDISMSYGGIWFGNSFLGNWPFHPTVSVQTGWGKIKPDNNSYFFSSVDKIFVVNPEIGLELNIAKFFRFSAGVNYKFVGGLSNPAFLSASELSGFGANFMLKFGWF